MASLMQKLTAEADGEPAEFLNDIVAQLWPNIDAAGCKIIKDTVDPMFKTMLPSPFSSLHFTKVELGKVPLKLSNVKVTKTDHDGINLAMNVDWEGKCDIELDGDMIPALGVESVELYGRLSILLAPLTNVIPLIGAAQVAFINPPVLKLDFTGAGNVADFGAIDDSVRGVILDTINGMFTLPNRYLVKLDAKNDYFKTFLYPLGIIRITVEKAWGFAEEAKGTASKLFSKITRAAPDTYAKVDVGAEPTFRTQTINNKHTPTWNETHDFVVSDFDQCIKVDVYDHDVNGDDEIGMGVTTVREILAGGGSRELPLTHKSGEETDGRISISSHFFQLAADNSSFSASDHKGEGRNCGLVTILVAGASGIKGEREKLKPSVKIAWGEKNFQTAVKSDAPGTDINNPSWDQNFRIDLTNDLVGNKPADFKFTLMKDETSEMGNVNVAFSDVLKAKEMTLQSNLSVGNGATILASICLQGLGASHTQEMPSRGKAK